MKLNLLSFIPCNRGRIMAAGGGNIVRFTYTGAEGERIPDEATHITVAEDCTFVRAEAFSRHCNIVEVICHAGVKRIEEYAFFWCDTLRRVIMPGVKIVERGAFCYCEALEDVECDKLEKIGEGAFTDCESLESINVPSAWIVERGAFAGCKALVTVEFGNKLERIEEEVFSYCESLERITIPLKDGLFTTDDIFAGGESLNHLYLVDGELHEIIAALQFEEWRNDICEKIDSINRMLPNACAGRWGWDDEYHGGKARLIRMWIRSVLGKIIHYQAEHQRVLDGGIASALEFALPREIAMNNVLPFLVLPHTFEGEYDVGDLFIYEEEDDDESDESRHRCCCLRKLWPSR